MIILRKVYDKIIEEAYKEAPLECCGYLAGDNKIISVAYPMANMDKSSEHFSFDPQEQFTVIKHIRQKKLKVLGVYHSHPETPARPSAEDIRLAFDPLISYVIISLYDKEADVRSFTIKERQVKNEELIVR